MCCAVPTLPCATPRMTIWLTHESDPTSVSQWEVKKSEGGSCPDPSFSSSHQVCFFPIPVMHIPQSLTDPSLLTKGLVLAWATLCHQPQTSTHLSTPMDYCHIRHAFPSSIVWTIPSLITCLQTITLWTTFLLNHWTLHLYHVTSHRHSCNNYSVGVPDVCNNYSGSTPTSGMLANWLSLPLTHTSWHSQALARAGRLEWRVECWHWGVTVFYHVFLCPNLKSQRHTINEHGLKNYWTDLFD